MKAAFLLGVLFLSSFWHTTTRHKVSTFVNHYATDGIGR